MDDRTLEASQALEPLLEMIEDGRPFSVTRNGKIVAQVVPTTNRSTVHAAADEIRAMKKADLGGVTIRELIEEGRKY